MKTDTAIIQPVKNARTPVLAPVAVMVSPANLLAQFRHAFDLSESPGYPLYHSLLYYSDDRPDAIALAGPMMGAPYAVAILETLIAWGARTFIFAGWCGAINLSLEIGDLIVPDEALSGEGTSHYYDNPSKGLYPASTRMTDPLKSALSGEVSVHGGTIWTTDAIYRETEAMVARLQTQSILAVDMELAALLAVAKFRQVELAGVLTVSDHLGDFTWRPGFKAPAFKKANRYLVSSIAKWAKTEAQNTDTR